MFTTKLLKDKKEGINMPFFCLNPYRRNKGRKKLQKRATFDIIKGTKTMVFSALNVSFVREK
ncbi:hypothetical protein EFK69_06265 [Lactococcus lactis subsp. lactis]|nr:hypothetical protein [Lactococcus lactis subsp. lactis]